LCADAVADYSIAASPVTGLRIPSSADVAAGRANPENRVFRGGGFLSNALRARTTRRDFQSAHKREHFCGLRPVRVVD
jgi:formylglycine-generating enzyme required for sulfatase activity